MASELTDTSLTVNGNTVNGIESTLSSNNAMLATSSAVRAAITTASSNVSSYVDSAISGISVKTTDVSSCTSFSQLFNMVDYYTIGTADIGNYSSAAVKSLLGNPFANYTALKVKRISSNTLLVQAIGLYVNEFTEGHVYNDDINYYFTGWNKIGLPLWVDSPRFLSDNTDYLFVRKWTQFGKIVITYRYTDNGTIWYTTVYPIGGMDGDTVGFHLYSAYGPTVHDSYGYLNTSNDYKSMKIQGSLSGSHVYLLNIYGFYNA